ncbi:MAG: putative glycosyltransferase [Mucilaginibacter sp.]|nr:putative glycosyltransferase [Mucilaginibacter sp.]
MKSKNNKLLAGCVILYNPKIFVFKNIESYLDHLDVLYVIDNSEIIDIQFVTALKLINSKIVYVPQNKNVGIASALNIAARLAINSKYNWLLTMDQDSYFYDGEFFDIWITNIDNDNKIGLLAASYTNEYDQWQKVYSNNFNEIHFAVTSGNIINLEAWSFTKGFEDKLFIDEVDHDYCLKLRKHKYKILTSKKVFIGHMIGEFHETKNKNVGEKKKLILHNPSRYYYMSRNVLYLCKKYFFTDVKFVLLRFYYLIKMLGKMILIYPEKLTYLKFFFRGIRDFMLSKYNKYSP